MLDGYEDRQVCIYIMVDTDLNFFFLEIYINSVISEYNLILSICNRCQNTEIIN